MKTKAKKAISIILAMIMAVSVCPLTVFADVETSGEFGYDEIAHHDGITYVELCWYTGTEKSITLPTELDGKVVVGMDYNFITNSKVKPTEIVVPEGYDYVGGLRGVRGLSITLPSSLRYIDEYAFQDSSISSINLPEGLVGIGYDAFKNVTFSDRNIVLPDSLKFISGAAFRNTNIESIHIGKNADFVMTDEYHFGVDIDATEIKYNAQYSNEPFVANCKSLSVITVDDENPNFSVEGNVLLSKDRSVLWSYPAGLSRCSYTTPRDVKYIAYHAFFDAKFEQLIIPNTIEDLGDQAFAGITADSISFEKGFKLTELPYGTFSSCTIKSGIVIPNTIEKIGRSAFQNCKASLINWEENSQCKSIDKYAFAFSSIESITIPASVENMGGDDYSGVFYSCAKLKNVTFEDNSSLTVWYKDMFEKCGALTNIDTGKNSMLKSIYCSFNSTAVTEIDFSNCYLLSYIDDDCFYKNSKIEYVNLDNTNLSTLQDTFNSCSNLVSVALPDSLYRIYNNTFSYCISLKDINLDNVVMIGDYAFKGCTSLGYTPQSAEVKSNDIFEYYELNDSITVKSVIDNSICYDELVIPSNINGKPVTRIGEEAFKNVEAKSLLIPNTVVDICNNAFQYAVVDEGITIPDSVSHIAERAFIGYQNTNYAKYSHNSLNTGIKIPGGIKAVSDSMFYKSGITDIEISDGVTHIGESAFSMTNVENFVIPDSVIFIDELAFNTYAVKSISFGANVENIKSFIINSFAVSGATDSGINLSSYPECYNVSSKNKKYASYDGAIFSKDMSTLIAFPCGKSFENYNVPDGVCVIGDYAFGCYNADETITVPDGVTAVGKYAFAGSKSFKNVYIPSSIKSIDEYALAYSEALENVTFDSNVEVPILEYTFRDCKMLRNVSFGKDCKIEELVCTFYNSGIEAIDLNCGARVINTAFCESSLREITLYDGMTHIGPHAFAKTQIEKIVVPSTVTLIDYSAFENCKSLYYVNLSNVQGIGQSAFLNCISLESIDLTGVYYIDGYGDCYAFYGCNNLKKLYFTAEEKEAYIAENEFQGNESVEVVVIGNSITEIQDRAFADCSNLQIALIADEVDNISDTAFENCELLTIVCMDNSPAMFYAQRNDIPYETFVIAPISDQYYTGKPITPVLDVKQAGKQLVIDKDYSAVYSNNINVGVAMVAVAGLGDYSIFGTTAKFNIVKNNNNIPSAPNNPPDNNQSIDAPSNPSTNNNPVASNGTELKKGSSSKSNSVNLAGGGISGADYSKASVSNNDGKNSAAESTDNNTSNVEDITNTETENTIDTDANQNPSVNTEAANDKVKDNLFVRFFKAIAKFFKSVFNIIKSWF